MRRITMLFCLFCLSACTRIYRVETVKIVNTSADDVFEKIAKENERNIVLLYNTDAGGNIGYLATGFVVGENGYILTVFHFYNHPNAVNTFVKIREKDKVVVKKVQHVWPLPRYDMTLVQIDYRFASKVKTTPRRLNSGERLFSMGHALTSHEIALSPAKKSYGRFYLYHPVEDQSFGLDVAEQLSSMYSANGASGSPVFDKDGFVVGITNMVRPVTFTGYPFCWSVPMEYYEQFLKPLQR